MFSVVKKQEYNHCITKNKRMSTTRIYQKSLWADFFPTVFINTTPVVMIISLHIKAILYIILNSVLKCERIEQYYLKKIKNPILVLNLLEISGI